MAGGAGNIGFKTVNCDGAVWTGRAVRDTSAKTQVNLCLWPYKDGYHLDFYMQYREKSQGLIKSAASSVAHAAVGSPKEWVAELVYDTVEQVQADVPKVQIKQLEGRPELEERPWLSKAGGS